MPARNITWGILSLISVGFSLHPAYSQTITPDGSSTSIEYQGQTYRITGGTQAGANLFHSFQQFGLNSGEIAQFLSQPGIEHILGRVTGGDPSVINGLLQVTGSNANLYLMNPAGIIFGAGSSLDIPGSFTATTGDRIGFSGGWFNAFGSNDYSQLIGNPNQFSFLSTQPGAILNSGNLTAPGNVSLIGGTVVNTGTIAGDHVTLAAVPGTSLVRLTQPGMLLTVEVEQSQLEAGITPLDLPSLLTGSAIQNVKPGEVLITNTVAGKTVDLMAAFRVSPLAPELIRTGDGTHHTPTVILFPENLGEAWAVNIIDGRADQPYDLLYGGKLGTVSSLILLDQEGISTINSALERVTEPIEELNVIAEGNQGNLWLGKTWLNPENIGNYQGEIQQWGEQLSSNAALLIYSCFTALGAVGEGFVNTLADLTGVTVAASTNATGSAKYGGDWQLEYTTGDLEVLNPFKLETLNNWDGKLATRTVTNLNNAGASSLRDALTGNLGYGGINLNDGDEIRFALSGTITLTSGDIAWTINNVIIDGAGQNVILDGNGTNRIFVADNNTIIRNLTLQNGYTVNDGGAILSTGNLTLENVQARNNSAIASGGGILGDDVFLTNSQIVNNSTNGIGGGIIAGNVVSKSSIIAGNTSNSAGGGIFTSNLTLTESVVTNNQSTWHGGGIYFQGTGTINGSTISGNRSDAYGGGILTDNSLTVINSTISGNTAFGNGGGIYNRLDLDIQNSTIAFNTSGFGGGGIYNNPSGTAQIKNTIVAQNSAPVDPDIIGNFTNGLIIYSLIGNTDGISNLALPGTNLIGVDPLLGPLQNNGGPTPTHALLPGSPAINGGDNGLTTVTVDQQGNPRISGGRVDIGAYEFQEPDPVIVPTEQPRGDVLQGCPPYCDQTNVASMIDPDSFLADSDSAILDVGIEEIENILNQEYADYLGLDQPPDIDLPQAQATLQKLAQQTGKNSAVLYIIFVPTGLEEQSALTHNLIANANLEEFPFSTVQRQSEFEGGTDQLQLVLVTPQGQPIVKQVGINRAQAVAAASRFNRLMARPTGMNYLELSQQFYNWLIVPIKEELEAENIDHLGIVADAGLRFIPFAALHDGQQFFIEQYSVGLMPSLSLTDQNHQSIQGLPILAMGASEFDNQSPLPAVPLELSLITEEIVSGQKFLNQDFTLARFQQARAQFGYSIVHLGTHGEFNAGSPENSYIELWGDRLTLDRIRELGLHNPPVELLVLSACRTALGSNEAELGFAGLAVQAGVKSALGSLWYVSDAGTLGLMSAFYQHLQTVPIKAEALRQAQLAMARGEVYLDGENLVSGAKTVSLTPELAALGAVDLSHPYYWSAFTMIGSPW